MHVVTYVHVQVSISLRVCACTCLASLWTLSLKAPRTPLAVLLLWPSEVQRALNFTFEEVCLLWLEGCGETLLDEGLTSQPILITFRYPLHERLFNWCSVLVVVISSAPELCVRLRDSYQAQGQHFSPVYYKCLKTLVFSKPSSKDPKILRHRGGANLHLL